VNLHIDFVWPFRKSEPAWRVALGRVPHTVKPDCSNMVKQTEDVMTKLDFWEDDGQVCNLSVSKAWGTHFGINVRIEELELPKRPKPPPKVKRDRKKKSPTQGTLL
jgi:Holliday junction resolvase RusA-like endonuclease